MLEVEGSVACVLLSGNHPPRRYLFLERDGAKFFNKKFNNQLFINKLNVCVRVCIYIYICTCV